MTVKYTRKELAQPLSIKQVEFVASQLSGNAGLIGAAFLAIKKHLYE